MGWRLAAVVVVVVGFFVGFGSGLIENDPGVPHIPENKYYGFPLVWRMINTATSDKFTYPVELFLDVVFGVVIAAIVAVAMMLTLRLMGKKDMAEQKKTGKKRA